MNRLLGLTAMLGLVIGATVMGLRAEEDKKDKKDKKPLTIKEIMKKAHEESDGLLDQAKEAAKDEKWDDLKKIASVWEALGVDLGKNKPKRGDEKAWKQKATAWTNQVKELGKAAEKKNKKGAQKALTYLGSACKACHTAHKGK